MLGFRCFTSNIENRQQTFQDRGVITPRFRMQSQSKWSDYSVKKDQQRQKKKKKPMSDSIIEGEIKIYIWIFSV